MCNHTVITGRFKPYHLGSARITRTSLTRINEQQIFMLYEVLFHKLMVRCQELAPRHGFRFCDKLYLLDSTTIDLWFRFDFHADPGTNSGEPY